MSVFESPLVTGAVLGIIAIVPSYLVYRHSKKVDDTASATGSIAQVVDGLNRIVLLTQADNTDLRRRFDLLDGRLDKAEADLAECIASRGILQAQMAELERKYGTL